MSPVRRFLTYLLEMTGDRADINGPGERAAVIAIGLAALGGVLLVAAVMLRMV